MKVEVIYSSKIQALTKLHDIITQNTALFIVTATISNPM
jgi:hypothetical protein